MARCLIALGANLGEPAATVRAALQQLAQQPGVTQVVASRLHQTAPVGGPAGQAVYVNAAARFETDLSPQAVLALLQSFEQQFGRARRETWGPRTLDLDLLLYDLQQWATPQLVLPHPRMAFRRFVLEPAVEIAGDWLHPPTQMTLSQLWTHVNSAPRYVAVASACWFAKQYVVQQAIAALHVGGLAAKATPTRGITVLGAPPIEDAEHSFVEHYCELVPRLASDLQQVLASAGDGWLLGSYWTDELKLGARLWFAGAAREAAEQAYQAAFAEPPAPRLVVYLQTPDDLLLFDPNAPGHDERYYDQARRLAAQRDELERHVQSLRGVPVLRLSAAAPEAAIRELIAAVQAMTPQ